MSLLTSSNRGQHSYRIPDGIRAEQRNGVAFLEAIFLDQRCRDVGCTFLYLVESYSLFGHSVGVSREFGGGSTERRVFRVEKEVPDWERSGNYKALDQSVN